MLLLLLRLDYIKLDTSWIYLLFLNLFIGRVNYITNRIRVLWCFVGDNYSLGICWHNSPSAIFGSACKYIRQQRSFYCSGTYTADKRSYIRSFFFTLIFFIERTKLLYICVQELLKIKRRLAVVILFKGFNTQGFDVGMIYISL